MGMTVNTNYQSTSFEQMKRELKEIESKGTTKVETLEDIRETEGKSFRTADLVKLMEKYDPDAYAEYSKFAKGADGAYTRSGLTYLSNWMDKVKKGLKDGSIGSDSVSSISKKNESNLSKRAQEFLADLRKQYGDYDFLIGNKSDDLKTLAKSGSKEFSVIFSSAEIERMANDEKYAKEKMQAVEGAVKMSKRICEENGFVSAWGDKEGENGTINKISISVDDDGNMKMFAELEKASDKQKERLEKAREKRAEEKKTKVRANKKNPYEKEDKDTVKRTTVEATSMEELLEKIRNVKWDDIAESRSGDRFDFKA